MLCTEFYVKTRPRLNCWQEGKSWDVQVRLRSFWIFSLQCFSFHIQALGNLWSVQMNSYAEERHLCRILSICTFPHCLFSALLVSWRAIDSVMQKYLKEAEDDYVLDFEVLYWREIGRRQSDRVKNNLPDTGAVRNGILTHAVIVDSQCCCC